MSKKNLKNSPDLWLECFKAPHQNTHKYKRGSAVIYAAPEMSGATNLATQSCARIGAGLVNVLAGENADLFRTILPAHVIVRDDLNWFDDRLTARLYGSGGMPCRVDFSKHLPSVLDADALQSDILDKIDDHYILTPHEGEFARLFPDINLSDRETAALEATKVSSAIIVLKGAQTIISHPDGRIITNDNSSPYLASAGTGDVLAGMITGLCAQGIAPFYAACAGVWIHGEAGKRIGAGLVASDIPDKIPEILHDFA